MMLSALPPDPMLPFPLDVWMYLGGGLWIGAYVVFALRGWFDRIHAVPMIALCLNFTWEAFFGIRCVLVTDGLCFVQTPGAKAIKLFWLAIDCVLLWQIFVYGRKAQDARIKPLFGWMVLATLALCWWWHVGFVSYYVDTGGIIDAFIINLIMSVLFIELFFERGNLWGLSIVAAVMKLFGTLFSGVSVWLIIRDDPTQAFRTVPDSWSFFYFLVAGTFLLDVVYVWLLYDRRKRPGWDTGLGAKPAPGWRRWLWLAAR